MPGQVLLMHTLHDDDESASAGIVKPGLHGLIPPLQNAFTHLGAVAVYHIVWVIDADDVTAIPGQSATYRRGYAVSCLIVLEPLLLVLIASQLELIAKVPVIPWAIDQAATLGAVSD